jgi:hypothetical protein
MVHEQKQWRGGSRSGRNNGRGKNARLRKRGMV